MEDDVVETIVAVDQRGRLIIRDVRGQRFDQLIHQGDVGGLRCEILLGPTLHLPRDVCVGPAVIGKPGRIEVDPVNRGQDSSELFVDRRPLRRL